MSVPSSLSSAFFTASFSTRPISMSVAFLPSRSFTVAFSRSRTSYTLPQTSGTPRSTFSRVYTASIPVRMEYSVVKMVSRGVSANWPRKAKFTLPSGTTLGRSP